MPPVEFEPKISAASGRRPRGHWDRHVCVCVYIYIYIYIYIALTLCCVVTTESFVRKPLFLASPRLNFPLFCLLRLPAISYDFVIPGSKHAVPWLTWRIVGFWRRMPVFSPKAVHVVVVVAVGAASQVSLQLLWISLFNYYSTTTPYSYSYPLISHRLCTFIFQTLTAPLNKSQKRYSKPLD